MKKKVSTLRVLGVALLVAVTVSPIFSQTADRTPSQSSAGGDEVSALKQQIAAQQRQIDALLQAVEGMKQRLDQTAQNSRPTAEQPPNLGQVASLTTTIPLGSAASGTTGSAAALPAASAPVTVAQVQDYTKKVDTLSKTLDGIAAGLGGFKFSGDLRFRFDSQLRSGNNVANPLQNVRERYRLRFNVNKAITDQVDFHLQLGSGTFNNPLTFDTDFAGTASRGPIFITELYGAYHSKRLELRGGKMEEVFADGSRMLFDDDVRFNGFHEIVKVPLNKNPLGITRLEFRSGEYILTNPNIQLLPTAAQCAAPTPPANCVFLNPGAGGTPGGKVRDAQLFHPGFAVYGTVKEGWTHQFIGDIQLYRNASQFQIASSAGGFPVLINPYYGITLTGGPGQTGNATTTLGGAIYTAQRFQVAHVNYRITHTGWKTHRQGLPVWLDLQASRNVGTSFERNAYMGTINVGEVKKFGDLRFLYIYAVKQANSIISQVTDDDLGTGVGVNIRTHNIRVDLGLTKFLQWQNFLFIQDELSPNDPARRFFVPLQRGADTTYRIQSQFQINF